jgi:hypothetical protein
MYGMGISSRVISLLFFTSCTTGSLGGDPEPTPGDSEVSQGGDAVPSGDTGLGAGDDALPDGDSSSPAGDTDVAPGDTSPSPGDTSPSPGDDTIPTTGSWTPPIGIPVPPFGIEETHEMYTGLAGYQDAGNGPFTHYVDRTHAQCSDAGNGTPAAPRCTLPESLGAGDVVEVHGGVYPSEVVTIAAAGTAAEPIFIRGASRANRPELQIDLRLNGASSYVIVENLLFTEGASDSWGPSVGGAAHHVGIRFCEIAGTGADRGFGAALGVSGASATEVTHHVVIYGNHIHDNGDNGPASVENDLHGVSISRYSHSVWIVDNHIHDNGGDAIQMKETERIFVGRNHLHNDRENAVDIKGEVSINRVVVSQNVMHGYHAVTSAGGDAIGAHSCDSADSSCGDAWIMFNRVYDSDRGIQVTGNNEARVLGNVVYDIASGDGRAIYVRSSSVVHVLHNTVVNAVDCLRAEANVVAHFTNNIATRCSSVHAQTQRAGSTATNNLFYEPAPGSVELDLYEACSGCVEADPLLGAAPDFDLGAGSPAIDSAAAVLASHQAAYRALFGTELAISFDLLGNPRPRDGDETGGAQFDIGAYER